MTPDISHIQERVLVLAPKGRDAQVIERVLGLDGFRCHICASHEIFTAELNAGAGAALVSEEALIGVDLAPLAAWLQAQELWSDFPFVLLVSKQQGPRRGAAFRLMEQLSNVILLERPVNAETLCKAASSALRARKRQYHARSELEQRTRAEERLRMALEAGRLGSWEFDMQTQKLVASDICKAHFGVSPSVPFSYADIVGAVHPDDRHLHANIVEAALAQGTDFDMECRVMWPDGSVRWLQMRGRAIPGPDGAPAFMSGLTLDITTRIEDNAKLKESQRALGQLNETLESRIQERTAELAQVNDRLMKEIGERERTQMALLQAQKMEAVGQLTGGIAHDFNNLLNVILGNVDLIDRLATDERVKKMAGTIRKATQRGAKLTSQLLAFSRNQNLDLKPVELPTVLEGVKDMLSASLGAGIKIDFDCPAQMPRALADFNQLELAVLNLAINAKDAMPNGGTLAIRADVRTAEGGLLPPGQYAVVSVSDTGTGISPDILSKVFDPFFTTKAVGKGTGLGLSQVYGIARQSGGIARIDSELGRGTTVEVWLPLEPELAATNTAPASPAGIRRGEQARILVVEDDAAVRQFMVDSLEILGYRVTQAEDGFAGLKRLEMDNPDLLIADFLMPGMNGAELVAKAHALRPDLPVIVATGYFDMQALDKVIGSSFILRKPFQLGDLATSVRYALSEPARADAVHHQQALGAPP
ncbi:MAG TPA: ATP-binding protein [Noviherbaspirillum sp.]|jgi:PAS domain S-box-containing protein|uniref:hybrid sensor histidine kinase/response regulator n=1 Tax=Noviherbaspirillum sp. TaxID=1926288 RepID=UPI002DDD608A|nr:ATP-binding protein [Noviherbaspirillum sp.]HEV2609160.1 ATP-binding protein [Noviherbaspirillum sp.]